METKQKTITNEALILENVEYLFYILKKQHENRKKNLESKQKAS